MADRPTIKAVAFDVFETVFPLQPLRPQFAALGLAPASLEGWFAAAQRDMAALAAAGDFKPFAQLLDQALVEVLAQQGRKASPEERGAVIAKFNDLAPRPDASECVGIFAMPALLRSR